MGENTNNNNNNNNNNYSEKYSDVELKLYPERRSGKQKLSIWEKLLYGNDGEHYTTICEYKILEAFKNNPLVKTLVGALKKHGCPINLKRHIVCEHCDKNVAGGFDSELNQVVICKNIFLTRTDPEVVLVHELIHMYDYCVNHVNFRNLEHLACTEIRAANLTDCGFLHSLLLGESSLVNIKKTHQYCVKSRATASVAAARNIEFATAAKYVLKVFDKCYNDLEPFGRRIRRNSIDPVLAEKESKHFKICDP